MEQNKTRGLVGAFSKKQTPQDIEAKAVAGFQKLTAELDNGISLVETEVSTQEAIAAEAQTKAAQARGVVERLNRIKGRVTEFLS